MRSVDMQIWPWCMKAPKFAAAAARVEVGILQHDERRLAAELEQHALEMAAGLLGDDPPTWLEPVKLMRRTAGCAISSSTTSAASAGRW